MSLVELEFNGLLGILGIRFGILSELACLLAMQMLREHVSACFLVYWALVLRF